MEKATSFISFAYVLLDLSLSFTLTQVYSPFTSSMHMTSSRRFFTSTLIGALGFSLPSFIPLAQGNCLNFLVLVREQEAAKQLAEEREARARLTGEDLDPSLERAKRQYSIAPIPHLSPPPPGSNKIVGTLEEFSFKKISAAVKLAKDVAYRDKTKEIRSVRSQWVRDAQGRTFFLHQALGANPQEWPSIFKLSDGNGNLSDISFEIHEAGELSLMGDRIVERPIVRDEISQWQKSIREYDLAWSEREKLLKPKREAWLAKRAAWVEKANDWINTFTDMPKYEAFLAKYPKLKFKLEMLGLTRDALLKKELPRKLRQEAYDPPGSMILNCAKVMAEGKSGKRYIGDRMRAAAFWQTAGIGATSPGRFFDPGNYLRLATDYLTTATHTLVKSFLDKFVAMSNLDIRKRKELMARMAWRGGNTYLSVQTQIFLSAYILGAHDQPHEQLYVDALNDFNLYWATMTIAKSEMMDRVILDLVPTFGATLCARNSAAKIIINPTVVRWAENGLFSMIYYGSRNMFFKSRGVEDKKK